MLTKILLNIGFLLLFTIPIIAQQPISAKVEMYNGRPTIFINDQPEYPMLYSLTDVPGGRWAWEELPRYNLKSFCQLGIKLIQVDIAFDHVWHPDGTIVTDTIQKQLRAVREACPSASVFIRFHVNPPKWWQQKYPEENTVYADAEPKPDISWGIQRLIEDDEETPLRTSIASTKWMNESTEKLKILLFKLQTLPEGNIIAGIQVAGGVYGEWHYWGFIENEPDMSIAMQNYFRTWLSQKYKSDKALQQAWHSKDITLAKALLPSLTERRETKFGIFRDPVSERKVIDYYEAQHQVVADAILHFCKVVKEGWSRPIITGAFYGYFYAVFGREAAGGHLQLQRVLQSPYIDYLSGPGTYYPDARDMGDPYRSRSLIHSVLLHKKLWLDEMDQQPPLVPLKDSTYKENFAKSIANVRRNILFTGTQGMGLWFYDFGPSGFNGGGRLSDHGSWGWWDEPSLRKDIQNMKLVFDKSLAKPFQTDADVLLVHDTESFYYIGSDKKYNSVAHRANNWLPVGVFKSGVVHDVIHLDDLEIADLEKYKAIVFVNAFVLTSKQKKFIQEKVAKQNRHLVWIYAPGYSNGQQLNTKFITEVTGITVDQSTLADKLPIIINNDIVKDYAVSVWSSTISPLFTINDKEAETLGKFEGTQHVGFGKKKLAESTSWFISLPPDRPDFWRYIFTKAGAHIYNENGDVIYSGSNMLVIHTKNGGERRISLRNGKQKELVLLPNSTIALDPMSGELLLH